MYIIEKKINQLKTNRKCGNFIENNEKKSSNNKFVNPRIVINKL